MEKLPLHYWLFFIFVQCANGVIWWVRGTRERPQRRRGYTKLVLAWVSLGNIPWLIIGAGLLSGKLSSFGQLFSPRHGNPFVLGFHASVFVLLTLGSYWMFCKRGAQIMVDHPGLLNRPIEQAAQIKLVWLVSLVGALIGEVLMWLQR